MDDNPYESPRSIETKPSRISKAIWIRLIEYPIVLVLIGVLLWLLSPATSRSRYPNPAPNTQSGRMSPNQMADPDNN